MSLTSRERLLTAISHGKPDRLPGYVHEWMPHYLDSCLDGCSPLEASERFGLDVEIHASPRMIYPEKSLVCWQVEHTDLGTDELGTYAWMDVIKTPAGELRSMGASNATASWFTEPLIKDERDFEIFDKYLPMPSRLDWTSVKQCREEIGDRGIVRGGLWGYGHPGAWQSFCYMVGADNAVSAVKENPNWVHFVERAYLAKQMKIIDMMVDEVAVDLIGIGGETGLSAACDAAIYEQFCLPYDRQQVDALREAGYTVVCSSDMDCLPIMAVSGADGLETPAAFESNNVCNFIQISSQSDNPVFLIGGFDQCRGFENGTPECVRQMVLDLHSHFPEGGYICAPRNAFSSGDPGNIQAFADALRECIY